MGFTPLEGLAMGTRCGDLDPAIIKFVSDKECLSIAEVDSMLNKKSGMLGLSGLSSDFRDVEEAYIEGNEKARVALDVFCYRVKKYIGAYSAAMNGLDAVVFTAGVGENSVVVRELICKEMDWLGIELDAEKNAARDRAQEGAKKAERNLR